MLEFGKLCGRQTEGNQEAGESYQRVCNPLAAHTPRACVKRGDVCQHTTCRRSCSVAELPLRFASDTLPKYKLWAGELSGEHYLRFSVLCP